MLFRTRKWIKPEDLNPNRTLFGGRLLQWIDEEAALFSILELETNKVVTKYIAEVNFKSSAKKGDIIEIGVEIIKLGVTSITLCYEVRNMVDKKTILSIDKIVMVSLDAYGKPFPHSKYEN